MKKTIDETLAVLENVRGSNGKWTAKCPAHDDSKNSLSIGMSEENRVLLFCHAGCQYNDVITKINQKIKDTKELNKANSISNRKVVATYNYNDEKGECLYQVVRTQPKGFYQRTPDQNGGWIYGLKSERRVVYNLPNVLKAIQDRRTVVIVEGERDADRINSLGLIATTSAMGAASWKDEYSEFLNSAHIVIIPDNDEAGARYAKKVINSLSGKALDIKLVELPGLSEKEDVSDWLDKGNTIQHLLQLIDTTPYYRTNKEIDSQHSIKVEDTFPCTDLGNAERLVMLHGNNIRYCHEAKLWLIWNNIRWEWDKTGEIERKAKETVRSIYGEAMGLDEKGKREELAKWALESESSRAIRGIPIRRSQLDLSDWLLNCLNGTIDLRSGDLRDHNREDYMTFLAPVRYDRNAKLDVLDKFLTRILPDEELREFIQVASGYSITGDTGEEKLFFAFGPPATGKSTLFAAIKAALGDYAATTDFETFLERKGNSGGPRNDIARLAGKRFVLGSEVDEGKKLAESLVKQITGNDTISARFLHQEFFEFQPKMKLWLAANFRPRVNANDDAMWRRILQAPFDQHIPKEERDPKVKQVLGDPNKGGPAIMAWLVEGCLKWQRNGLKVPKAVEDVTNEYKEENDPLKDFLSDCCIVNPLARVSNTQLWDEYETWCSENGEKFPLGRKKFTQRLEAYGFTQERTAQSRFWKGVGLFSDRIMTGMTVRDSNITNRGKDKSYTREISKQESQVSDASQVKVIDYYIERGWQL